MGKEFVTVIYVLFRDNRWCVRIVATGEVWEFLSRNDAESYAKEMAIRTRPSEIVIKRMDGSVDYILHF
jgi:hypothetical protein